MHTHTADCIGANELGEVCCGQMARDDLMAAKTWIVSYTRVQSRGAGLSQRLRRKTIDVFAADALDAVNLAVAAGYASAYKAMLADPQPVWP